MSNYLLFTGATGLVGQYLLRDLLSAGVPLAVLIRSTKEHSASQRLEQILTRFEADLKRLLPRPVCLDGDITAHRLGLNAEAYHWATRYCGRVLHNAASLTFHGLDQSSDPWLTNLAGTKNVLEFCRDGSVRELHHMSTAFVCGKRRGPILETELDLAQDFRNDYERSKCEAEKLIRSATFLDPPTIYRPAIILGDSRTGHTTTYNSLYSYLHFISLVGQHAPREEDGRWFAPLRLNVTGEERRNLVTVDWVAAATTRLLLDPRRHGATYHLTPIRPTALGEIEEAASSYFNYYGPTFAGPEALADGDLNDLETLFYHHVEKYEPYWSEEPTFDCRTTLAALADLPCPHVDRRLLHRLIDFAVRDHFGRKCKKRTSRRATREVTV